MNTRPPCAIRTELAPLDQAPRQRSSLKLVVGVETRRGHIRKRRLGWDPQQRDDRNSAASNRTDLLCDYLDPLHVLEITCDVRGNRARHRGGHCRQSHRHDRVQQSPERRSSKHRETPQEGNGTQATPSRSRRRRHRCALLPSHIWVTSRPVRGVASVVHRRPLLPNAFRGHGFIVSCRAWCADRGRV
jgi:hypothetical protein